MSEAAAVGRSVVKVRATDQDTGPNAEITYKIISGDDQGKNASREVFLCVKSICIDVSQRTGNVFVFVRVLCCTRMISYPIPIQNANRLLRRVVGIGLIDQSGRTPFVDKLTKCMWIV